MWTRKAMVVAAAAAMPALVFAQEVAGNYLGIGLVLDFPRRQIINDAGLVESPLAIDWGSGLSGLVYVGRDLGHGLRVELEASRRRSDVQSIQGTEVPNASDGSQVTDALMINGLYALHRTKWPAHPYLGVGVGYAWARLSNYSLGAQDARAFGMRASGTHGGLAYQAMLGLSFPIRRVPRLSLNAEIRFFGTASSADFPGYKINPKGLRTDSYLSLGRQQFTGVSLGLHYVFGAPAGGP